MIDDNVDLGANYTQEQLQQLLDAAAPGWSVEVQVGDYQTYLVTDGMRRFIDTRFQDAFGRAIFVAKGIGELDWDGNK